MPPGPSGSATEVQGAMAPSAPLDLLLKSFELLFSKQFIFLDPNTCYISLTPYTNYRAKDWQC